jgi:hypothetical protein
LRAFSEKDMRHLLEEVSDRTPSLVLSVVHTTEQHPNVREGELFCSDSPGGSSNNAVKALAEIETHRWA